MRWNFLEFLEFLVTFRCGMMDMIKEHMRSPWYRLKNSNW